jgi:hypothetical protein
MALWWNKSLIIVMSVVSCREWSVVTIMLLYKHKITAEFRTTPSILNYKML